MSSSSYYHNIPSQEMDINIRNNVPFFTKNIRIDKNLSIFPSGIKIEKNVPMKNHTSFRVGGPADYFVRPASVTEFMQIIKSIEIIRAKNLSNIYGFPCTIMGGGTNILVKDQGIRGLVISLTRMKEDVKITNLNHEHTGIAEHFLYSQQGFSSKQFILSEHAIVSVSAGTSLTALCLKTIKLGLEDLSFAAGIPGTVGGAVMMNAGTGLGTISDRLISIDILDQDNNISTLDRSQLLFSHRKLEFVPPFTPLFRPIILRASFLLTKGSREKVERSWKNLIQKRRASQPHGFPSAGCFFKNPDIVNSTENLINQPIIPAGKLIDMAGLKRKRVGDAMVSDRHANFILNLGNATASEILTLRNIVKETVFKKFGVHLSEEVIIQGE
ncbi:MAG: UDP-N-acetylmuramate dehydrogenase [Desulfamplus sp.]|nr:UDP-N-acetylmuramate dehydrogenase [Desulfamplus sp.]